VPSSTPASLYKLPPKSPSPSYKVPSTTPASLYKVPPKSPSPSYKVPSTTPASLYKVPPKTLSPSYKVPSSTPASLYKVPPKSPSPSYKVPSTTPASLYKVPPKSPSPSYKVPSTTPASLYKVPPKSPSPSYKVPSSTPASLYKVPPKTLSPSYKVPSSTPASLYKVPPKSPSPSYKVPSTTPASLYKVPPKSPSPSYKVPSSTPASLYKVPPKSPSPSYKVPSTTPASLYKVPPKTLSPSYKVPSSTPASLYKIPPKRPPSSYSAPPPQHTAKPPSQLYRAPSKPPGPFYKPPTTYSPHLSDGNTQAQVGSHDSTALPSHPRSRYRFEYGMEDEGPRPLFGHAEAGDAAKKDGQYFVNLPDGRTQTVFYHANDTGYFARVVYTMSGGAEDRLKSAGGRPRASYPSRGLRKSLSSYPDAGGKAGRPKASNRAGKASDYSKTKKTKTPAKDFYKPVYLYPRIRVRPKSVPESLSYPHSMSRTPVSSYSLSTASPGESYTKTRAPLRRNYGLTTRSPTRQAYTSFTRSPLLEAYTPALLENSNREPYLPSSLKFTLSPRPLSIFYTVVPVVIPVDDRNPPAVAGKRIARPLHRALASHRKEVNKKRLAKATKYNHEDSHVLRELAEYDEAAEEYL
ncbi:pro-resilin-like, partial [Penaeus indicus]|uniref:pro-resilin-like n=1 Tax=Penaeus indicus TaxID=29960 RepID=UPI00300D2171